MMITQLTNSTRPENKYDFNLINPKRTTLLWSETLGAEQGFKIMSKTSNREYYYTYKSSITNVLEITYKELK